MNSVLPYRFFLDRFIKLLFAVACTCVLAAIPCPAQDTLADVIERAERSVVRIEVRGVEGDSLGSGFVIDDEGTMITNCHVLAGARQATAFFNDGRAAEITGTLLIERTRDIIVAKIDYTDAPALPINSSLPRKGERVIALGAPKGLDFTATQGIVSAIRTAEAMESDVGRSEMLGSWIQVDTAISPGSSGGPLINSQGEVVAMSTLASQGSAQSLNFGISAIDIANAIKFAKGAQVASLAAAAINVRMTEQGRSGPPGRAPGGTAGGIVRKSTVDDSVMEAYVQQGIDEFRELKRGIAVEVKRLRDDLAEIRNGSSYIPPAIAKPNSSIVRATIPGRRSRKWYFRSQSLKDSTMASYRKRIREYSLLSSEIVAADDPTSMQKLLLNFGPELNTRRTDSIGWTDEVIVAHAFNDHDVLVFKDDAPYLMWLESTSGLSEGEFLSGPVYVAGTATVDIGGGITASVTVLQDVSEEELKLAVNRLLQATDEYRKWTSANGKSTVEAKLLDAGPTDIILQRRDGQIVRVPRSALSQVDRNFVNNQ
ncbi:MAG: hypothetical protein Aurels2KO_28750 [Aureliella sp.]